MDLKSKCKPVCNMYFQTSHKPKPLYPKKKNQKVKTTQFLELISSYWLWYVRGCRTKNMTQPTSNT